MARENEKTLKILDALKDNTRTYQDIADEFNVTRQHVHSIAKRHNLVMSINQRKDIKISNYLSEHTDYNTKSVCDALDICSHTFYSYCTRHNIPTYTFNMYGKINKDTIEMYKLKFDDKLTYKEIANRFGISEAVCRLRVYRYRKHLEN